MLPKGTLGDLFSKTMKSLGLEKHLAELAKVLKETIKNLLEKITIKSCIEGGANSADGAFILIRKT